MDEFLCTFSKRCISRRWLCDNYDDCGDAADENITNCISRTLHRIPLKIEQIEECKDFLCASGECLPWSKVCDFQIDCADLSDEGSLCTKVCARNGGCSQKCIKTPYEPKCSCFNGFSLTSDGKTCEDVNECLIYGSCSHFCNNTKGGFKCSCAEGYFLEHDHRRCKAIGGPATLVYILSDEIRGIDMNTHTPKVHLRTKNSLLRGIDYNSFDGVFYCSDRFQKTINSYTVDSNRQDKLISCEKSPSYVRWDWITKIIYYVEDDGTIKACSKDGKYCSSLLKPVALYLSGFDISPTYGFMFWCVGIRRQKWSSGIIERAEMDGSNRTAIISENIFNPLSLTVDFIPKLIYWFDSKYNILECTDFHGQSRKVILISHAYSPLTFTIFEDYVFFADYNTDSLIRCNKFTGVNCVQFHKGNGRYVEALMAVHVAQQPESINRCASNQCSQLCVPTHSSYVCRCSDNFTPRGNKCDIVMTTSSTARPKLSCPHAHCLQGARCIVVGEKFACQCPAAYMGDKCEIQIRAVPGGPYIYFWCMVTFIIACLIGATIFCILGFKEIRLRNKIIARMSELRNEMPEVAKYYY
ncbi:vitellogenin receptor-like [Stegodyphus dumicola]|uniref:vitellogenin receptor-like n=1 Tax=Stegodyphus dumicola TaxID=202533 RepID=UPI0015AC155E|nr:vitellogenin receptor-like [Stegodyphus dumicola]